MKINWKDHFVNLIVVILGISIAFWLNSWSESKKSSKTERRYLEGMIKDLQDDHDELDYLVRYGNNQLSSLNRLTRYISRQEVDEDSLTADIFQIQYNLPFTPQDITYQSIIWSGKMDMIEDYELRYDIIELYNQGHKSIELWDVGCKEQIDNFIKPVVFEEMRYVGPGRLDLSLIRNQQFSNAIFAYHYLQIQRVESLKSLQAVNDSLKVRIEKYLAR